MRQQNRTAKSVCAAQASSTGSVYATALISLRMAAFRRKPRRMGGGSVIRAERPGDAFPEPGSGGVAHGRGSPSGPVSGSLVRGMDRVGLAGVRPVRNGNAAPTTALPSSLLLERGWNVASILHAWICGSFAEPYAGAASIPIDELYPTRIQGRTDFLHRFASAAQFPVGRLKPSDRRF